MNLRRHRKPLTALVLGAWLFALFVGIANACLPRSAQCEPPSAHGMAMPDGSAQDHHSPSANCLQFCADDTPVLSKLQLLQDQSAGQPLLVATSTSSYGPATSVTLAAVHRAHPPSDVPLLLLSLRLAL